MSPSRPMRRERGSMSVEVVLMVPILVLFLLLVLMGGRYVTVRADIESAARDAARAASFERSESAARQAAYDAAKASDMDDSFSSCAVDGIGGAFEAGGVVTVTVRCTVSNRGLTPLGIGGSEIFEATSSAPIDRYRRFE
jgi:Flp pilus assembly protein TadG